MSEVATFNDYTSHTRGCQKCRPTAGVLCDQGGGLWRAWRQECDRQPAPPKKAIRAGGRPRREVAG